MSVIRGFEVRAGGLSASKPKVGGMKTAGEQVGAAGVDSEQADLAGLMARLVAGILDAPEDGAGRVAALRQSMAEGSYRVSARAVADKVVEAMEQPRQSAEVLPTGTMLRVRVTSVNGIEDFGESTGEFG